MAIPAGISTALVHLDAPVSFAGADGRIHATITPSTPLVWAATGTPIGNFIDNISLDPSVPLELTLPHVDQAGFLDGAGNTITGWAYRVEITYERNGQNIPLPAKDFQILVGQDEVDLALVPSGQAYIPVVAPILPVTSIKGLTGEVTMVELALDRVDNTNDAEKPISTAAAAALALKAPIASPTFTGTVSGITKAMVGLSNVDNTTDLTKPISASQQAALDLKVPWGAASPRVVGDNKNGALDWRHEGTAGYLTHFVMGANSLPLAGAYAAGTDLGQGDGFFVSHKNSGAGIRGIGQGGSSILQYMVGYSHSTLYNGEIFKGNQGIKLFAKIGEGFGDGVANGTTTFTSATAAFTGADVGQTISQTTTKGTLNVTGTIPSGTTIASVTNATTVVLSAAATASGTGINFLIGGRAPVSTQSLFTMYDTNGTSKRYEFTLGKYTGLVPHELQSNDVAAQSLLVKAATGHTAEIFTVLKDNNATGALSVTASGIVAARFGSSLSNAGDTAQNAVNITNYSTTTKTLLVKGVAAQTGDQVALQDSAGISQSRFNKDGVLMTRAVVPVDAQLTLGELAIAYDSADGAPQVVLKAKDVDGTLFTRNLDMRGNVLTAPGGAKFLLGVADDGALTTTSL